MKISDVDLTADTFEFEHRIYTKDFYLQTFLEKMFDTKFEKVFVTKPCALTKIYLNVGCRYIIIVKKCGRILHLSNSEWGVFEYLK